MSSFLWSKRPRLLFFVLSVILISGFWQTVVSAKAHPSTSNPPQSIFRVGFSRSTIGEINENDAMAAVRIWAMAFLQEKNIAIDPQPTIFKELEEIEKALTLKNVECINITTVEYFALKHLLAKNKLIVSVVDQSINEEYVVLVNRVNNFETLSDLQGRILGTVQSARNSLALPWLDTVLGESGFGSSTSFFGAIRKTEKVAEAVLPVFFNQVDACLVTRNAFETMAELNPQIKRQLKVLATSPALVPVLFSFRSGFISSVLEQFMDEIQSWNLSQAGRQILTIFQIDSLEKRSTDCLDSAIDLLLKHQLLFGVKSDKSPAKSPLQHAEKDPNRRRLILDS